jgi:hypothetical protein
MSSTPDFELPLGTPGWQVASSGNYVVLSTSHEKYDEFVDTHGLEELKESGVLLMPTTDTPGISAIGLEMVNERQAVQLAKIIGHIAVVE